MDIHRYNKSTRNIDKIKNVPAYIAEEIFKTECNNILGDSLYKYYRVTLFDPMRQTEVKDSDGPIFTMDINLGLR